LIRYFRDLVLAKNVQIKLGLEVYLISYDKIRNEYVVTTKTKDQTDVVLRGKKLVIAAGSRSRDIG
jgi:L-2-hydroxyglutarate oxidase LhgO